MASYRIYRNYSYLTPRLIIDRISSIAGRPAQKKKLFSPTLKCGEFPVLPPHRIPDHIRRPPYGSPQSSTACLDDYYRKPCVEAEVKSKEQVALMRKAGRIAANCLKTCMDSTWEGMTAEDVDRIGHEFIIKNNAYPAGINFHGFPKALCISVNEVACHGIPNLRPFKAGDVVSYDCTVYHQGVFGDCAGTVIIGTGSEESNQLVNVARECMNKAIQAVGPEVPFSRLADVVTSHAEAHGFGVIREFGGHFIGEMMHMPPMIQFKSPSSTPGVMKPGHVFTIEPIICQGDSNIYTWDDGWTIATCDSGFCAQFEHTVLVTKSGCEILTLPCV